MQFSTNKGTELKLKIGSYGTVANEFRVSYKSVQRLWKRYTESVGPNGVGGDVSHRKKQCGVKRKSIVLDDKQSMVKLPKKHKKSQRSLSAATGVSQSTISRRCKDGDLKKSTSNVLSMLSNKQKIQRVQFTLDQLEPQIDNFMDRRFDAFPS